MKRSNILAAASALLISAAFAGAQTAEIQPYGNDFKVFQFPRNAIPRIDGDFSDWEIVPDS